VHDVSFSVRAGEILGLAGLAGCRRSELAETIFGLTPAEAGEIRIQGAAVRHDTPGAAIRSGIGYVPKDRRRHGVVAEMSIAENVTLASLPKVSRRGLIRRGAEKTVAGDFISRLGIKAPSSDTGVAALSGGNQQKVILAKWLAREVDILLLDDPTQGVDVAAKAQIHALVRDFAKRGGSVLLGSSDLGELARLCDTVVALHRERICARMERTDGLSEQKLLRAIGG
jgi:ABC-type sugar transport system ATPase subunit